MKKTAKEGTSMRLDPETKRKAKINAAKEGRSLTNYIERLILEDDKARENRK